MNNRKTLNPSRKLFSQYNQMTHMTDKTRDVVVVQDINSDVLPCP